MAIPEFQDAHFGAVNLSSKEEYKRQTVSQGGQTREIEVDCCSTQTRVLATAEVCVPRCPTGVFDSEELPDVYKCGTLWETLGAGCCGSAAVELLRHTATMSQDVNACMRTNTPTCNTHPPVPNTFRGRPSHTLCPINLIHTLQCPWRKL